MQDKPREKLQKYGPTKLDDPELIAIILGSGISGKDVFKLSQEIWQKFLIEKELTLEKLMSIKGLGLAKATKILAAFELVRRISDQKSKQMVNPETVWQSLQSYAKLKKEHLIAIYLDARSRVIEREVISIGTVDSTMLHPREIFEPAIRYTASQIIIAHNHPSGNVTPSNEDREMTAEVMKAGDILKIKVVDHIIFTEDEYFSFMEANFMN